MTNSPSFPPLFPGMLLDAAARFAQDNATTDLRASHTVRDMGWACTLVPEDAGGVGGSFADLAAVIEGLAQHGVQLPVIETCAVAPLLLQAAAPEVAARWLQAVAEGSAVAAPLAALATGNERFAPVLALLALLVLWLHRANIARLRAGTEPKVGGSKQP